MEPANSSPYSQNVAIWLYTEPDHSTVSPPLILFFKTHFNIILLPIRSLPSTIFS
jgi:hypothetical protein